MGGNKHIDHHYLFTSKGIVGLIVINFLALLGVKLCLHFEYLVPASADHLLSIGTPVNREDFVSVPRKVKVQLLLLQVPHLGSENEREGGEREREKKRRVSDNLWFFFQAIYLSPTFSVLSELPLQSNRLSDDQATYTCHIILYADKLTSCLSHTKCS